MLSELTMEELLRENPAESFAVSIYLDRDPEDMNGRRAKEKLKALIQLAETRLRQRASAAQRKKMTAVFETCFSGEAWIPSTGAVGFFYSFGLHGYLKLPFLTAERVFVSQSFHLKPVYKWLYSPKRFYLLFLSAKESTLYRGSSLGMERMVEPLANSLRGNGNRFEKQIFSLVEETVVRYLHGETAPLLLAGEEGLCERFAQVCSYPFMLPAWICVNPGNELEKELHSQAIEKISKFNRGLEQFAIEEFLLAVTRNKATTDLNEVAQALAIGRVKRLLVADDTRLAGKIKPGQNILTLVTHKAEGDNILDDLAELAAAHRSLILILPRKRMPGNVVAAATFRW
jgi:hypothetical protein